MFANLTGWHFLILLAIVLLVFGATKLPALAKSLGQSVKIIKSELNTPESKSGAQPNTPENGTDAAAPGAHADVIPPADIHAKL